MQKNSSNNRYLFIGTLLAAALLLATSWGDSLYGYYPVVLLLSIVAVRLQANRAHMALIVLSPIVLVCFYIEPELSDDYQRYLWEGFVQAQGYSPFQHAPNTLYEELEHPSEGKINHDGFTAIYPPLAQYLFRLSASFHTSVYAWKILLVLLYTLFWAWPKARHETLWWMATPAVLLEGLCNGHLDVVGLIPSWYLVHNLERQKPLGAGLALAAMVALKIMPILLLPACLLVFDRPKKKQFLAVLGLALLLLYAPFLTQIEDVFASFRSFAGDWHFNNPFYLLFKQVLPNPLVRPVLGACLLSSCILLLLPKREIRWRLCMTWLALIFCSPTVYPWYLLWLLPFTPLKGRPWTILAYLAAFLSYQILVAFWASGIWHESWRWLAPEWCLLLYACYRLHTSFSLSVRKLRRRVDPARHNS